MNINKFHLLTYITDNKYVIMIVELIFK